MINHSDCDHPRTSSARAKCRRAQAGGAPRVKRERGATPKAIDEGDNYGQTPSRKDMECHKCGVERIAYRGTDPISGILLFVGEKCFWYIKNAPDRAPVEYL